MKTPTKKQLEQYKQDLKKFAEYEVLTAKYESDNRIEFFTTPPNPGPNPKQAQILEAFLDPFFKTFGMSGGNRLGKCVTYQTLIDTPQGGIPIGKLYERGKSFDVFAWDGKQKVITKAMAPFKKPGRHQCYHLKMSDGRWIEPSDIFK